MNKSQLLLNELGSIIRQSASKYKLMIIDPKKLFKFLSPSLERSNPKPVVDNIYNLLLNKLVQYDNGYLHVPAPWGKSEWVGTGIDKEGFNKIGLDYL